MNSENSDETVSAESSANNGDATDTSRNILTVLGSGRSGTSLLMQVLRELGMSTGGGTMIPASGSNPEGFLEDAEIVDVHKALTAELQANAVSPLPADWLKSLPARNAHKELAQIIMRRLEQSRGGIWGFKDPRTNNFMPLWVRLFNQPGLNPCYLLAIRNPASVMASLREQGRRGDPVNELLWLRRNLEALHHTAGNCFIVHYEDWFERPEEVVNGLLTYTGLDRIFRGDVADVVNRVVKARLNRAPHQHEDVVVRNPCVNDLYDVLRKCHGANFDHAALMQSAERAYRIMASFDVVAQVSARKPNKSASDDQAAINAEVAKLVSENGKLLGYVTSLTKEVESLRTNLYVKTREAPSRSGVDVNKQGVQFKKLQNELRATRQSYAFRVGWVMVNAVKKPGMNTIKAPFRIAKLFWLSLRARGRV